MSATAERQRHEQCAKFNRATGQRRPKSVGNTASSIGASTMQPVGASPENAVPLAADEFLMTVRPAPGAYTSPSDVREKKTKKQRAESAS